MNEIQIFNNPEFGQIRTLTIDGDPWFVGKDVAQVLGYSDTNQAIRKHVDEEDKLTRQIDGSGQNRDMTIINESGLYSLILSSKLPSAKKFKHWVTSEVLPSIRKTGSFFGGSKELQAIFIGCLAPPLRRPMTTWSWVIRWSSWALWAGRRCWRPTSPMTGLTQASGV